MHFARLVSPLINVPSARSATADPWRMQVDSHFAGVSATKFFDVDVSLANSDEASSAGEEDMVGANSAAGSLGDCISA